MAVINTDKLFCKSLGEKESWPSLKGRIIVMKGAFCVTNGKVKEGYFWLIRLFSILEYKNNHSNTIKARVHKLVYLLEETSIRRL